MFVVWCGVDPDTLQAVALSVAAERSVDRVIAHIVDGLAAQPGIALARVWLVGPGDICDTCELQLECGDRTRCLHLCASAGASLSAGEDWSRLTGKFRRFPLGLRKIGQVGASGRGILIDDVRKDDAWIARPEWIRQEGIRSIGAQPLIFRGEILGVLAVFNRQACDKQTFAWLRTFADHAAIAIAHARALAEIERLKEQLELENTFLREDARTSGPAGIIGSSAPLRRVLEQVAAVAPTPATVLIQGESGTGKELIARAIHDLSPRRRQSLIGVNCASIPRELFESEFFGHVKGAFTGAVRDRGGRFQAADEGTLFLDEVGEIPLDLQAKLLRVLQEGRFERIGEEVTRKVDVRIIAATNRRLEGEVEAGRFRRDLYYRLSVFPMTLPPLRDRVEDIPSLAAHFVAHAARRFGRPEPRLTARAVRLLQSYPWPGNVRELQHVVERALLLSPAGALRFDGLLAPTTLAASPSGSESVAREPAQTIVPENEWRKRERQNLRAALDAAAGRVYGPGGAAELLGVKPSTLVSRLTALGVRRPSRSRRSRAD